MLTCGKRWNTVIVMVFLFGGSLCAQNTMPSGTGKASLDNERVMFGNLVTGAVGEQRIAISNVGEGVLNIVRIVSNCGCVVGKAAKNSIIPGESSDLTVSFDTGDRTGDYRGQLVIFTDSQKTPSIALEVTASISPLVEIIPKVLVFDQAQVGKNQKKMIILKSKSPLVAQVILAEDRNGLDDVGIDVSSRELKIVPEGTTVDVTATAHAIGTNTNRLVLKVKHNEKEYSLVIPVVVKADGPVKLEPSSMWFNNVSEKRVQLLPGAGLDTVVPITGIKHDSKLLDVKQDASNRARPTLLITPKSGGFSSHETVRTNVRLIYKYEGKTSEVVLPIYLLKTIASVAPSQSAKDEKRSFEVDDSGTSMIVYDRLKNKSSAGWTSPPRGELEALPLTLKIEGKVGRIIPQGDKRDYEVVYLDNNESAEKVIYRLEKVSGHHVLVFVVEPGNTSFNGAVIWKKLLSLERNITILLLPGKIDAEAYMREARGQWKGQTNTTNPSTTSKTAVD